MAYEYRELAAGHDFTSHERLRLCASCAAAHLARAEEDVLVIVLGAPRN